MSDPEGPNVENLRKLYGMLPSFAAGLRNGTLLGKGKSFNPVKPVDRICTVCGAGHKHENEINGTKVFSMNCASCQALLEEGFTAVRSTDHRYAFVKGGDLEPGKVLTVTIETMNKIKARHDAQRKDPSLN